MKKARIIFNNEEKIVSISEELHTQYRITEELAGMFLEEDKLWNLEERFRDIPLCKLPAGVLKDILSETDLQRVWMENNTKRDKMISQVIKEYFNVDTNIEVGDEFEANEEDKANNIVINLIVYEQCLA